MDAETKEILEVVNSIKDKMVTKDELQEGLDGLRTELKADIKEVGERVLAVENRLSAMDNRIDDEAARRKDLENRVRNVLPKLSPAPERV
ncbi:MAG TPA: hypothetical protein VMU13_00560 [Candidatus Paceibacterota bacterium]|nr:hypothetical protein [Candidatus Paceibacterota bacterium]